MGFKALRHVGWWLCLTLSFDRDDQGTVPLIESVLRNI